MNTFKSDILTQPLTCLKNHVKMFENQKWMLQLKPPHNDSSIFFFHQKFELSEIQTHFYLHTPDFQSFQIWTFWPKEPKNMNFPKSFMAHDPQPKWNQKSPEDPK